MTADGRILMTMHRMSQGGADRVAVLIANGFQAAGMPVDFLLLRSDGEGEEALSRLIDPAIQVHTAGPPLGSRHLEIVRGIGAIRKLARSARPALVLASSSNMGLVTGIACEPLRRSGIRVAMKLTNPVIRPRDRFALQKIYRRRLYRFIFARHDRILTLTDAERADLEATYPGNRFVTVPNAYISGELLSSIAPRRTPGGAARQLLALARMMPQKRLDILLRAFALLERKDVLLTILGDGPLRSSLENLARSLGIADRVAMPGFVENVHSALCDADLVVLSSDYEGLPAALLEALASNVPVVTTDCFFGARALLEGVAGCAVTPIRDPTALARAIDKSLAKRPSEGLAKIAAPYTIEASIEAHIKALRAMLDEG